MTKTVFDDAKRAWVVAEYESGKKQGYLAKQLGISRKAVQRALSKAGVIKHPVTYTDHLSDSDKNSISDGSKRLCARCLQAKLPNCFRADVGNKDGFAHSCEECKNNLTLRKKKFVLSRHEPIVDGHKKCFVCRKDKAISEFNKCGWSKDGLSYQCNICERARQRLLKSKRADQVRAYYRKWRDDHREQKREEGRIYARRNALRNKSAKALKYFAASAERINTVYKNIRNRAKELGIEFDLTREWIDDKFRIGACEVTGLPFCFDQMRGPFSPSFDRRDPTQGYTHNNVQIVVLCYNMAKGTWGHEHVLEMALALSAKKIASEETKDAN